MLLVENVAIDEFQAIVFCKTFVGGNVETHQLFL